jgi:hypothetical protein
MRNVGYDDALIIISCHACGKRLIEMKLQWPTLPAACDTHVAALMDNTHCDTCLPPFPSVTPNP